MEKSKTKAISTKQHRAKGRISFSSKENMDYKSEIRDEIDLDKTSDKQLL